MEFALVSQRIVTSRGIVPAAIIVREGLIADLCSHEDIPRGVPVVNVGRDAVLPGLVDVHVHVNEPGRTDWEGFATATRAAAAGGVTTIVDMPLNSAPVTTTVAALDDKRRAARGKCTVDVGFHGGLIPGNADDIEPLIDAGVLAIKAFLVHSGIDDFPNARIADLRAAMPILTKHGIPLLVHAEWDSEDAAPSARGARKYADYLASRPRIWETRAIEKLIALVEEFGTALHIVHLANGDALPLLAEARRRGLPITVETAPHYLYFHSEEVPDGDTRYKCAPPIREAANRDMLWTGLREGIIDLIATDHSPCPPELKGLAAGDHGAAWGGISSLQSGLSAVWTEAARRGFTLVDIARWMSEAPARSVGLTGRKGVIAPGADADFVVLAPEATYKLAAEDLHYRHKVTPYEERTLRGIVKQTYLRGSLIYYAGDFAEPIGEFIARSAPQ